MKNMKNYSNESGYTVCPATKEELREIIKKTIKEKDNKCDLNFIDTSKITDMSFLFSPSVSLFNTDDGGFNKFNGDISKWDVSNVEDTSFMFYSSIFNGDISKWDVSNVVYMTDMFALSRFNGDISKWDVSNVVYIADMFCSSVFNGDISEWDVSNVENMTNMFALSKFDGDISKWNVKGDCNVSNMFGDSSLEYKAPKWYYDIRSDVEYYD